MDLLSFHFLFSPLFLCVVNFEAFQQDLQGSSKIFKDLQRSSIEYFSIFLFQILLPVSLRITGGRLIICHSLFIIVIVVVVGKRIGRNRRRRRRGNRDWGGEGSWRAGEGKKNEP